MLLSYISPLGLGHPNRKKICANVACLELSSFKIWNTVEKVPQAKIRLTDLNLSNELPPKLQK